MRAPHQVPESKPDWRASGADCPDLDNFAPGHFKVFLCFQVVGTLSIGQTIALSSVSIQATLPKLYM